MTFKIDFIGCGEASYNIAKGSAGEGPGEIAAYGNPWVAEPRPGVTRQRAQEGRPYA